MIIREFYMTRPDGVDLYRSYSNTGMMIRQNETGAEYAEAIDVENRGYTYSETDTSVDAPEPGTDEDLLQAAKILLGVVE